MQKVMFRIITNPERPEHAIEMPVNADLVCTVVPVPIKGQTVGPKGEPTIKLVAGLNFSGYIMPVYHSITDAIEMVFGKDEKPVGKSEDKPAKETTEKSPETPTDKPTGGVIQTP